MTTRHPVLAVPPKEYDQAFFQRLLRTLDLYFATIDNPGDALHRSLQFTQGITAGAGLVLVDGQSPPHYWKITVSNTGVLQTTDLGTTNPVN